MKVGSQCVEGKARGCRGGKDEMYVEVKGDGEGGDLTHPTGSTLAGEKGTG